MNIKTMLGKRIKKLRIENKLTQQELAEKINIASKHQSRIETGKSYPSAELTEKYARVFKIYPEEILKITSVETKIDKIVNIYNLIKNLPIDELNKIETFIKTFK